MKNVTTSHTCHVTILLFLSWFKFKVSNKLSRFAVEIEQLPKYQDHSEDWVWRTLMILYMGNSLTVKPVVHISQSIPWNNLTQIATRIRKLYIKKLFRNYLYPFLLGNHIHKWKDYRIFLSGRFSIPGFNFCAIQTYVKFPRNVSSNNIVQFLLVIFPCQYMTRPLRISSFTISSNLFRQLFALLWLTAITMVEHEILVLKNQSFIQKNTDFIFQFVQ